MTAEIWKTVPDYEDYEVSNLGNVRSNKFGLIKPMTLSKNPKGYLLFSVCKDGKGKKISVSRMVGLLFIDNPDNKPQIDHINRNKNDNTVENLRWATNSENCNNKTFKDGNCNQRYIFKRSDYKGKLRYVFTIKNSSFQINRSFESLSDAIIARDIFCEKNNITIN